MSKNRLHKLLHWEYWHASFFYVPNLPYAFYLAAKARHLVFYSAANPCIKSSGNGTESKYETIQLIPEKFRPKSILHSSNSDISKTLDTVQKMGLTFPLIAKPDIGFRGLLVTKIHSEEALEIYLKKYPIDILIQEFIAYEKECGVFYFRKPKEKKGHVTSLTLKTFLSVVGDGKSTLKDLILKDCRAKLYFVILFEIHKNGLKNIPKNNEKVKLSAIGNHSKGTQFICGNHLISSELVATFDKLSHDIPGWYYGRIDLKYNTFEEVEKGSDFKILEINGILAEPTHIYDADNYTYFQALRGMRKHWKSLYEVATVNHKENQVPYKSVSKFVGEMFELRAYTKKIDKFSKKN